MNGTVRFHAPISSIPHKSLKNSSREIFACLRMSRTSRAGESPECTATVVRRVGSFFLDQIVMASFGSPCFKTSPAECGEHLPRRDLPQAAHARVSFAGTTSLTIARGSESDAGICRASSRYTSRHSSSASRAAARASSSVRPFVINSGNAAHRTVYPPRGFGRKVQTYCA